MIGHAVRVTTTQAALVNGASSHVLDYDDVNLSMNGHPSAAVLPGLLALAEARDASGSDMIAAFVAGYEIACRVGLLVAPGHYRRGYHATSTVGAVAAAGACAHLLGLDSDRTAHALGIAATQAGGLKSMFGTECKPFHAGLASQNGLRAARLAAGGMIARPDGLECTQGFAKTLSPNFNPEAALADPDKFYLRENLFKYHASCYGTHASIEAIHNIRKRDGVTPEQVKRMTLRVETGSDAVCNIPLPKTALEAKFSLRFMGAAALAGADTGSLGFYSDDKTRDPALVALRDKTKIELVEGWPMMQAEAVIETNDGRVLRETTDAGIPGSDVALQGRRLTEKFERLVKPVLGDKRAAELLALLNAVEKTPVAKLMKGCATA